MAAWAVTSGGRPLSRQADSQNSQRQQTIVAFRSRRTRASLGRFLLLASVY